MDHVKTASLDEIRKMQERGALAAARGDAKVEDMPDGFWDNAEVQSPIEDGS